MREKSGYRIGTPAQVSVRMCLAYRRVRKESHPHFYVYKEKVVDTTIMNKDDLSDRSNDPVSSSMDEEEKKDRTVHHQDLKAGDEEPKETLIYLIAAVTGKEPTKLTPLYSTIDHLIEELFTSPPPAKSQAQIEFYWEGCRITIYHDGNAIIQEDIQDAED